MPEFNGCMITNFDLVGLATIIKLIEKNPAHIPSQIAAVNADSRLKDLQPKTMVIDVIDDSTVVVILGKKNYEMYQCLKSLGAETTNNEKTEYKINMTDVEYGPHTFPSLQGKFTSMAQQMGWSLTFLDA